MRRLGQRVVRAQGLDQPGMNDLGILAELRLEDGDAHEAAAKWIETPPGNPADQPKRITALSETVAMLVTKIGDAIAHLPGAEKVFRRGLVARNPAELASALGLAGALISGEMSREVAAGPAVLSRPDCGWSEHSTEQHPYDWREQQRLCRDVEWRRLYPEEYGRFAGQCSWRCRSLY